MISRPTTAQLIQAACTELTNKVGPAVSDTSAKITLDMAVAVLTAAAARAGSEIAWMRDEAAAIEQVTRRLAARLPDAAELRTALEEYDAAKTGSLYLEEAVADYDRASSILSCAIDAAYESGDPEHKAAVRALIDQRMANENHVIGQYVGVGRG
jgi:hypothetical protein